MMIRSNVQKLPAAGKRPGACTVATESFVCHFVNWLVETAGLAETDV
jgi:hypothetical protein